MVGLGNPGPDYAATRHNAGFRVVDAVARRNRLPAWKRRGRRLETAGPVRGATVALAKPLTYMNLSGAAVVELLRDAPVEPGEILVVYDELDLALGRIRLRPGGAHGGHNGMRSIIERLGTRDLPRLRIGIGPRPGHVDGADFVLEPFHKAERDIAEEAEARAADAVELAIAEGLHAAMNRFNPEPQEPPKP